MRLPRITITRVGHLRVLLRVENAGVFVPGDLFGLPLSLSRPENVDHFRNEKSAAYIKVCGALLLCYCKMNALLTRRKIYISSMFIYD
jgi:hypothetical protein